MTPGFATAKGAQRMLTQSLARDLGPKGVHCFYVIVDGSIGNDSGVTGTNDSRKVPKYDCELVRVSEFPMSAKFIRIQSLQPAGWIRTLSPRYTGRRRTSPRTAGPSSSTSGRGSRSGEEGRNIGYTMQALFGTVQC